MPLLKLLEHRVHLLERLIDVLLCLGPSQHDLSTCEDQQHDLGGKHSVDQTWEDLRLVSAELLVLVLQTLQRDGETHVAGTHNVLDLEFLHVHTETHFLDGLGVLLGSVLAQLLTLGSSADHLARGEDESGGLRLSNSHDDSSESSGVVLSVPAVQSDRSQVELGSQVGGRNNILQNWLGSAVLQVLLGHHVHLLLGIELGTHHLVLLRNHGHKLVLLHWHLVRKRGKALHGSGVGLALLLVLVGKVTLHFLKIHLLLEHHVVAWHALHQGRT